MVTLRPADAAAHQRELADAEPARRAATGRAVRKEVPRSAQADLDLGAGRRDPIALLEEQARSRVPELVPVRHGRMLVSPFSFFRGAALVMAADLARTPSTPLWTQLCGDAHLSNFGLFASPERRLVFDVNDFDETDRGPFEWDLKRLVASVAVLARDRGFSGAHRRAAVLAAAASYRTEMRELADLGNLEAWYRHAEAETLLSSRPEHLRAPIRKRTSAALERARTNDSLRAMAKLTTVVDGHLRIVHDPPLVVPIEVMMSEAQAGQLLVLLREIVVAYRATLRPDVRQLLDRYRLVHMAHKVVGVGSVGTRAWIGLFLGRDGRDPLFLQAKEAQESVLRRVGAGDPDGPRSHGARVVAGQHVMQAASDIFLGWASSEVLGNPHRDFYIRQLRDWKGSLDVTKVRPEGLALYAGLCGVTLARAHGRGGDRIAISGYLGRSPAVDHALLEFAERYADQNEADHRAFAAAVADGRLEAVTGL